MRGRGGLTKLPLTSICPLPALQLMNIGDADKKVEYVEHWQGQPLVATTCITCMDVMKLTVDEVWRV